MPSTSSPIPSHPSPTRTEPAVATVDDAAALAVLLDTAAATVDDAAALAVLLDTAAAVVVDEDDITPGGNGAMVPPPGSVATAGMPAVAMVAGVAAGVTVVERSVSGCMLGVGAVAGVGAVDGVDAVEGVSVASGSVTSKLSVLAGAPGTGAVMPNTDAMTEPHAGGGGGASVVVVLVLALALVVVRNRVAVPVLTVFAVGRARVVTAGTAVGQAISVVV